MRLTSILFMTALASFCVAQTNEYHPFVEEGKIWHMRYSNPEYGLIPDFDYSFFISGDTIIAGKECKKLYRHNWMNEGKTDYQLSLYESDSIVYSIPKDMDTSYVLYNFTHHSPGATIEVSDDVHPEQIVSLRNAGEKYLTIEGTERRCIRICNHKFCNPGLCHGIENSDFECDESGIGCTGLCSGWWIEGIGSELGPLISWLFGAEGYDQFLISCELNGQIIFDMGNFTELTESATKLLSEGKRWEYYLSHYVMNDDGQTVRKHSQYTVWVEGDTIISGSRYYKIRTAEDGVQNKSIALWEDDINRIYCRLNDTEEYLVYDFGIGEGDIGLFKFNECTATYRDRVLANGVARKRINIRCQGVNTLWVSGIGNPGVLTEPAGHEVSDGREYTLISCYNGDECVFRSRDFCLPSYNGEAPGRLWSYAEEHFYGQGGSHPVMDGQRTIWTIGQAERDGRTYDITCMRKGLSMTDVDTLYVRHEDGRVYVGKDEFCRVLGLDDQNVRECYACEGRDVVLYDFTLGEGDAFGNTAVAEVSYLTVDGTTRKCLALASGHKVVEGIGALTGGYFLYMTRPVWQQAWDEECIYMLESYEENGRPILTQDTNEVYDKTVLGINNAGTTDYRGHAVYSISGTRMPDTNLSKGIYIKDGKKFVVK